MSSATERSAVAVLDPALWKDLQQETDERAFAVAWLSLTCRGLAGAVGGALLMRDAAGAFSAAALWPEGAALSGGLAGAAKAAAESQRGVVQPPDEGAATSFALPVTINGQVRAVAGIDVTLAGRDPRAAMRHLQWAAAWVQARLLAAAAASAAENEGRLESAIDLVAAAIEQPTAAAATRAAATELAAKLHCERVAIGFLRRRRVRVASISHSAAFGQSMTLTRAIEAAMDEAVDQFAIVLYPPPDEAVLVTKAHEKLASGHAPATVLTLPLLVGQKPVGAVTFERPRDRAFSERDLALAQAAAAVLGPVLADKRRADRALPLQAFDRLVAGVVAILGPRHYAAKLALIVAAALAFAAWRVQGDYQVYAHARVVGAVQRVIAAPFDGFVREAPVRAGDRVKAGDLVVGLDDRDLVLERLRWVTERDVHVAEYDSALSAGKRADAARLQNQIAEAQAQIRLADEQLARTRLVAPFDGLVVSGDLTQSIGSPLRRGDVLFEIAPTDDWRVEVKVPETQIADVAPGQTGALVLAALPDTKIRIAIQRVTPVADAEDGQMTFRADARLLDRPEDRLRPGMEGSAKIEAGRARVVWIWTRALQHWAKLALWSWWP